MMTVEDCYDRFQFRGMGAIFEYSGNDGCLARSSVGARERIME